jgi:hypothetical protein
MEYWKNSGLILGLLFLVFSFAAIYGCAENDTVTVSGRVLDDTGAPLQNALVRIDRNWIDAFYFLPGASRIEDVGLFIIDSSEYGITETTDGEPLSFTFPSLNALTTTTDAAGLFEFNDLPAAQYWIFADSVGYIDTRQGPFLGDEASTDLTLTLKPIQEKESVCWPEGDTFPFEGSITDGVSGQPVQGATILLVVCKNLEEVEKPSTGVDLAGYMHPVHPNAAAVSDENGQFTVNAVPIEETGYDIFIGREGYVVQSDNRFLSVEDGKAVVKTKPGIGSPVLSHLNFEITPVKVEEKQSS